MRTLFAILKRPVVSPMPASTLSLRQSLWVGLLAVVLGLGFGLFRLWFKISTNDLWLAYGSAQLLWTGENPYTYPTGGWPSNPLTTVLVLMPFTMFPLEWVGAGMITISTALFIFGALRIGDPWRLFALASWPFWYNVIYAQWGILFLAMLLLPEVIWLAPVKPQLGMSVFLSHFHWRQALYAVAFLFLSWVIYPGWPTLWLAQVGGYDGFIPMLYLPISIFAIFLVKRRATAPRKVWFFLLFCCTPQRLWHDQLLLWFIPNRRQTMILLTALSWLSMLITIVPSPIYLTGDWAVILIVFLPVGLMLLAPERQQRVK